MATLNVLLAFLICSSSSCNSILFQSQTVEASTKMVSQNDCQRKCGKVEIPYPFGMKKGCYLDKTFEVTCNVLTGSASIAWLDWEVEDISISNHTLRRKNFIVQSLSFKSEERLRDFHDLERMGDHYWISHTENMFVAKACDVLAYLYDDESAELLGLCASSCNISTNLMGSFPSPASTCRGLNCCHIQLLKDVRNFSLEIHILTNTQKSHCGFFTFVAIDFPLDKLTFTTCDKRYFAPVVYEWAVGNTSCNEANICGQNTECINSISSKGYRCKCRKGYQGNPYLHQGCQDIDECENPEHNKCNKKDRCFNTEGSYYCWPNHTHMLAVLIHLGISLAVGLLILVGIGLWTWQKIKNIQDRKEKQRFFKRNGGLILQQQVSSGRANVLPELTLFKIEELEKATDKFNESRILGKGGLGTVYKGMLSDGRLVAVKKANITDESQVGQFINEVFILSQINHRHIVKLLGCCLEVEVPLLVYEYVSNGTLSRHIHDEPNSSSISLEIRLRIAAEIAEALAYLHSYASTAIFHRDIKSSNILLDKNDKAVIADFGLARSVSIDRTHLTTSIGGTFGYLDPEYFQSGQLNDKSDVYAFGVVLAEILTGKKAVSSNKDDIGLALRFRSAVKEHFLLDILDKVVVDEGEEEGILAVAELAKKCLKVNARKRPSMREVAAELDQLRKRKEIPRHRESFLDEHCSISEKCYGSGIDSEAEDHLTIFRPILAASTSTCGNSMNN